MITINRNYLNLKENYLFADIEKRVKNYQSEHPSKNIIRLGIGDVTLPLAEEVTKAMERAVSEMKKAETFRGYGEYQGYEFLREAISGYYKKKSVSLSVEEIFVSDGAKSDNGNILDIFGDDNVVLIPDPVYPVYVDTNIMAGREIVYMKGTPENNFLPIPDGNVKADIIYLCSPNNPTGAVYNREQLKMWVDYAIEQGAVIFFDSAYEAFIQNKELPSSIYEIPNADKCAIEFCSLSKTAGFTGVRCGYTIVPKGLVRDGLSLNQLWLRRQTTKFNGVSYIVQRGAEAAFSEEGCGQIKKNINYYLENAKMIVNTLNELGIWFVGGDNSPYIWLKCPKGMSSWEFFDFLLTNVNVVGTPGAGFGEGGEGFFRLTAFGNRENVTEAMRRVASINPV